MPISFCGSVYPNPAKEFTMKRLIITLAIGILATTLTIPVLASDDPNLPVESGPASTNPDSEFALPVSALGVAIEAIQLEAQGKVRDLGLLLSNSAPGSSEAQDLQRQIAQVKVDTEVAILDAIIKDASDAGDEPRMVEAQAARDRLVNPEQYVTQAIPSDRPNPSN
jgi:hypothetical protein